VCKAGVVLTFRYQSSSPLSTIDHSDAAAKVSYKNPVPALMIVKITPVAPSAEFKTSWQTPRILLLIISVLNFTEQQLAVIDPEV